MQSDIEFAQAAIDMLPGSVEEIERFLREQGIKDDQPRYNDRPTSCPVARWVRKWTDTDDIGVGFTFVRVRDNRGIPVPYTVMQYLFYVDSK